LHETKIPKGVAGSVKGGNGWLRILDMDFRKKNWWCPRIHPIPANTGPSFYHQECTVQTGGIAADNPNFGNRAH
jgi:hypothetical protein